MDNWGKNSQLQNSSAPRQFASDSIEGIGGHHLVRKDMMCRCIHCTKQAKIYDHELRSKNKCLNIAVKRRKTPVRGGYELVKDFQCYVFANIATVFKLADDEDQQEAKETICTKCNDKKNPAQMHATQFLEHRAKLHLRFAYLKRKCTRRCKCSMQSFLNGQAQSHKE